MQATLSAIADLQVRTAPSGEIAIDLIHQERPDLILMDVMMPGLDGPATLQRIHSCEAIADIPVIFLTAKVMPAEVDQLLDLGAIGVIGKPFDPMRLGGEIRTLWNRTDRAAVVKPVRGVAGRDTAPAAAALTDSFLERAQGDVGRLRHALDRLRVGDQSALREFERLAHSIHGAAAMFGFPTVSDCGGAIENLLKRLANAAQAADPTSLDHLSDRIDRLAQEVEATRRNVPRPTGSSWASN